MAVRTSNQRITSEPHPPVPRCPFHPMDFGLESCRIDTIIWQGHNKAKNSKNSTTKTLTSWCNGLLVRPQSRDLVVQCRHPPIIITITITIPAIIIIIKVDERRDRRRSSRPRDVSRRDAKKTTADDRRRPFSLLLRKNRTEKKKEKKKDREIEKTGKLR